MSDPLPVRPEDAGRAEGLLTTAQMAALPDFSLDSATISPSTRRVIGPAASADLEPRVMQVLVVLAEARGQVVTRETLFNRCWGGVYVGDDSLNRAIAALRKAAVATGAGFDIETVPRTGYVLKLRDPGVLEAPSLVAFSRRKALAAGAALLALPGLALWARRSLRDREFVALMTKGDEAFRDGTAFRGDLRHNDNGEMAGLYEQAVRLRPDSARAWGLLAYYRSAAAEATTKAEVTRHAAEAQMAIRRAIALDPTEPNARLASYRLEGRTFDWITRDRTLRGILRTDPANLLAMSELMQLLQAAGLTRESWAWNERILKASPFAPPFLIARAMKLWILGRTRDADSVIDRVRGLWPDHPFAFLVRFRLFALTDRPQAALALLDSSPGRLGGKAQEQLWRSVLGALESRDPSAVDAVVARCVELARKLPERVNDMVMILGALGRPDQAYAVTEGFLLWRGKLVSSGQADGKKIDEHSRRMTQWLFTPPMASMRADPRFARLCDEFGLTAYWQARGVEPDYRALA